MASKAAQAELARKRCTPSSGVLVLPNTEVDSVAEVVEPSRDTHGYWPQKGASPFPKKGRLKAPADIHPQAHKSRNWNQKLNQTYPNHVRDKECGQEMTTSALKSVCINCIKQCPIMSRTLSTCAVEVSQILYVLCFETTAPVNQKDPGWPKPTDHNGQYTQNTPGHTFQWSVAGAKLQKMD